MTDESRAALTTVAQMLETEANNAPAGEHDQYDLNAARSTVLAVLERNAPL